MWHQTLRVCCDAPAVSQCQKVKLCVGQLSNVLKVQKVNTFQQFEKLQNFKKKKTMFKKVKKSERTNEVKKGSKKVQKVKKLKESQRLWSTCIPRNACECHVVPSGFPSEMSRWSCLHTCQRTRVKQHTWLRCSLAGALGCGNHPLRNHAPQPCSATMFHDHAPSAAVQDSAD